MAKWTAVALATLTILSAFIAPERVRAADSEAIGFERTPPRLAFAEGEVSFLRAGAEDWSAAQVNLPLAAGDELYTAADANLEVQIGPRAYLRAGEETQLALTTLEPDFLQLRVSEGSVSLDLRTMKASQTFEVDTPKAAFTIERSGYYRIRVTDDTTTFVARRGGRARLTAADASATVAASEQLVLTGSDEAPRLETYAAPELDSWDRWNYARTDSQLDAVSSRYVPTGVYGVEDLDHHGDWRVVPNYGAVWVPRGLRPDWAPYTTGQWILDPYYGWTWVDSAPWGWAPYHYGRWVSVSGYWAWAPGPLVVRPYYAPALVAFFGGGGVAVGISVGTPGIGWLALGWGEPLIPWWGPRGCRGVPRWGGWGGPRVVNHVVIEHRKTIRVRDIHKYQNEDMRHAFVAVERQQFGRRRVGDARIASAQPRNFQRLDGDLGVQPTRASLAPSNPARGRPPRAWRERTVIATRAPRPEPLPAFGDKRAPAEPDRRAARSRVRLVSPSKDSDSSRTLTRPPFGSRGEGERRSPPPAPRFGHDDERIPGRPAEDARPDAGRAATPPRTPSPTLGRDTGTPERTRKPSAPSESKRQRATPTPPDDGPQQAADPKTREQTRSLPGEPANRVYRQRDSRRGQGSARGAEAPQPKTSGKRKDRGSGGGDGKTRTGNRGQHERR